MSDEDDVSMGDFFSGGEDYRGSPLWRMKNIGEVATRRRPDTDIIVQHPVREEAGPDSDVEYIETLGLSVSQASISGTVTVQNTQADSTATTRFVAFDVGMVDDLIVALKRVKATYESGEVFDAEAEMFVCPGCKYPTPYDDLDVAEEFQGLRCPECAYIL